MKLGMLGFHSALEAKKHAYEHLVGLKFLIIRREDYPSLMFHDGVSFAWIYPTDYGQKLVHDDAMLSVEEEVQQ